MSQNRLKQIWPQTRIEPLAALSAGIYPSIEQQARTLYDEKIIPEWTVADYERWVACINGCLLGIMIKRMQKHGDGFDG